MTVATMVMPEQGPDTPEPVRGQIANAFRMVVEMAIVIMRMGISMSELVVHIETPRPTGQRIGIQPYSTKSQRINLYPQVAKGNRI